MTSVVHTDWPSSSSSASNGYPQANGMNGFAQPPPSMGGSGHRSGGFTNYRVPSTGVDTWEAPPTSAHSAVSNPYWNSGYDYGDYQQEQNADGAGRHCDPWIAAMNDLDRDNLIRGKIGLVVNQRFVYAFFFKAAFVSAFVSDCKDARM